MKDLHNGRIVHIFEDIEDPWRNEATLPDQHLMLLIGVPLTMSNRLHGTCG